MVGFAGTSSINFEIWGVPRLGYVRRMKKVKPGRVQAVVEIDVRFSLNQMSV